MPPQMTGSTQDLLRRLFTSGLLGGAYEAIIEDAILFASLGLVTIANPILLIWIACIEFVGPSQILLLLTRVERGAYLKTALVLWGLMTPVTMICFLISPLLSTHLNYLWIWGPITATLIGAFAVGFPFYVPHTKVPLGYATLTCGVIADFVISSTQQHFYANTTLPATSFNILLPTLLIITGTGALLILIGLTADHIQLKIDESAKKRIRNTSIPYLLALIGLVSGILPPYAPLIIFVLTWGTICAERLAKTLLMMTPRSPSTLQTNARGLSKLFAQISKPRNSLARIFRMDVLPLFKRKPLIMLPVERI